MISAYFRKVPSMNLSTSKKTNLRSCWNIFRSSGRSSRTARDTYFHIFSWPFLKNARNAHAIGSTHHQPGTEEIQTQSFRWFFPRWTKIPCNGTRKLVFYRWGKSLNCFSESWMVVVRICEIRPGLKKYRFNLRKCPADNRTPQSTEQPGVGQKNRPHSEGIFQLKKGRSSR